MTKKCVTCKDAKIINTEYYCFTDPKEILCVTCMGGNPEKDCMQDKMEAYYKGVLTYATTQTAKATKA